MERRQEAKRLEQDLVDAHQQGRAAALPPKSTRCFDTDTPAEESGDGQTPDVRLLFIEAKRGRAMRFAPRRSGKVSRYPLPCSKKGKGENDFCFIRLCPGREREGIKAVCECVCVCVYYGPRFLFCEFPTIG